MIGVCRGVFSEGPLPLSAVVRGKAAPASGTTTSSIFKESPVHEPQTEGAGAGGGPASSKLFSNEAIGAGPIRFALLDFVVIVKVLTNKLVE